MLKLLVLMVSLLALGMLATACGGGDPTPVPAAPSVSAQDIQDAVDRAIAGAAAAETSPAEIQAMIEAAVTAAAAAAPEGLTASQVEAIVAAALAAAPTAMPAAEGPFVIGVMESLTGPGETYGNVAV